MTPEAERYLLKAREFLVKAREVLEHWPDEAGRASYLAAFHAAQALIFERTGTVAKTHSGVRAQFGKLVKEDPDCGAELRSFLGRAYNLKATADYETGPGAEIAPERAALAITTASRFVSYVAGLLRDNHGDDKPEA
nr:HEPN domain-containing protein [uncultured Rhodopila sp.]